MSDYFTTATKGVSQMLGWGSHPSAPQTQASSSGGQLTTSTSPASAPSDTLLHCQHTWRFVPPLFAKPTACDYCHHLLYVWEGRLPYCQQCKCSLHNACWDKLRKQMAAKDIIDEVEKARRLRSHGGPDLSWAINNEDTHDGLEDSYPLMSTVVMAAEANVKHGHRHVHELNTSTTIIPSSCDVCKSLMIGPSYSCTGCYYTIHKDCVGKLQAGSFQLAEDTHLTERMQAAATNREILMTDTFRMLKRFHSRNPKWNRVFISPLLTMRLLDSHRQKYRQLCDSLVQDAAAQGIMVSNSNLDSLRLQGSAIGGDEIVGDSTVLGRGFPPPTKKPIPLYPPMTQEELSAAMNALRFATASYGESYRTSYMSSVIGGMLMRFVARDLLEPKEEVTNQAVVDILGLPRENLLYAKWSSLVLEPSYCCIFDRRSQTIFIVFRGSLSDADFLSDAHGDATTLEGSHAHAGMLKMMLRVYNDSVLIRTVKHFLKENKAYSLVVTGHSLGAALTCLLAMKLIKEKTFGDRPIKAYAFAPPPVASLPLAGIFDESIYSFIAGDDIVCRMQMNTIDRLAAQIEEVSNGIVAPEEAIVAVPDAKTEEKNTEADELKELQDMFDHDAPPQQPSPDTIAKADDDGLLEPDRPSEVTGASGDLPAGRTDTDGSFVSISHADGQTSSSAKATNAPLTEELHIVGRCFFMTNPNGPSTTNNLIPIDRTHPLLHNIFVGPTMVANHLMDTYQASMAQCLKEQIRPGTPPPPPID